MNIKRQQSFSSLHICNSSFFCSFHRQKGHEWRESDLTVHSCSKNEKHTKKKELLYILMAQDLPSSLAIKITQLLCTSGEKMQIGIKIASQQHKRLTTWFDAGFRLHSWIHLNLFCCKNGTEKSFTLLCLVVYMHYNKTWFFSHNRLQLMTLVWSLQCTICGVYCGIYYIKIIIYNLIYLIL
jgi:hypothetical protein